MIYGIFAGSFLIIGLIIGIKVRAYFDDNWERTVSFWVDKHFVTVYLGRKGDKWRVQSSGDLSLITIHSIKLTDKQIKLLAESVEMQGVGTA